MTGTPDPATGRPKSKDYHADLVLTPDGQQIGISAGRVVSTTYRRMISLAFVGREHADLGTELVVLWGNPGTRLKPIRATVARFPYLTDERNDKIDVERIPRFSGAANRWLSAQQRSVRAEDLDFPERTLTPRSGPAVARNCGRRCGLIDSRR